MKVLIAIDSMKGSLSSIEGGKAIADGVHRVFPEAFCDIRPLADGGEGTLDALVDGLGGDLRTITVTGPAQKPVEAVYGIIGGIVGVGIGKDALACLAVGEDIDFVHCPGGFGICRDAAAGLIQHNLLAHRSEEHTSELPSR